jgi:toxin FitB
MFLLDTVVISELRKPPRRPNRNVAQWIGRVRSQGLFVSVLTVGEIERGIQQQQQTDPAFSKKLSVWLDIVLRAYEGRILPVTVAVARRRGRLSYLIGNKGLDLAIASTALEHGLTVATGNVSDFAPTGVAVINPFDPAPQGEA